MKLRKRILALGMAAVMTLGSTMTALASENSGSETGLGTNTGHLDTDVVVAILPTNTANLFNFTVDPENILAKADKFTDGTTAAGADFANTDLVYFKQAAGADKAFASSSQAVKVAAKNYVDADVSVEVTANDAETNIPLVDSAEALAASETPALLLTVKVGSKTGVLTSSGVTVTDTIAAQDNNFDVKRQDNGSYKVVPKDAVANEDWAGVNVQLSGKVKGGTVAAGVTAPTLELTWTVAKHVDVPVATPSSMSTSAKQATISNLGEGVTLRQAQIIKVDGSSTALTASTHYTFSNNVFAIASGKETLLDNTKYTKIVLTFSDDSTVEISIVAAN